MIPILVDERRLAAGVDAALGALAADGACSFLTPAAFLERLTGMRVVSDAERRAIVRRIAATRDDIALPANVRASPSFARRAVAAIDETEPTDPFGPLIDHYRTLLAFANVLDVPDALHRALAGERRPIVLPRLRIDGALLDGDGDGGFRWRRVCAAAGIALEPLALPPPGPPTIDAALVAGIVSLLRYAADGGEADLRAVLVSRIAGVAIDDARALLASCAQRGALLAAIDAGTFALTSAGRATAAAFARGVRAVVRAYEAPDAGAGAVLAAIGSAFVLDHEPTVAGIVRVARDFDRARALGPAWDAAQLAAEFAAEFAGARTVPVAPLASRPAPAASPAAPLPVAVRRMRFSASALNAYAECARKWYFRYVCAAVEDRGSSASFYGTAFHAALEEFHLRYPRPGDVTPAELGAHLESCVFAAFERYRGRFDAPVEYELQRRRARRTAKRYLHWLVERARRAPFEVIGCEVSTELELGGYPFLGYIDRLDRDDRSGTITVVDYKTGTIAQSARDYRADVLAFRDFQLPFYYWARTEAGDHVTKLALVPLKDALLDIAPIELEVVAHERPEPGGRGAASPTGTIARSELERARARMIAHAAELSSSALTAYAAATDPAACRFCAYAAACRTRPIASDERFAR